MSDTIIWAPPGEPPVRGTVRRMGKGRAIYVDWETGRRERLTGRTFPGLQRL